MAFDTLAVRNMTHHIERTLLEQKLEGVNTKMSIKDLRLELSAMENRNLEVRSLLERWRNEGTSAQIGQVAMDSVTEVTLRLDSLTEVLGTIKNGVGDLKAEWLMIKREVKQLSYYLLQNNIISLSHSLYSPLSLSIYISI